MRVIVANPPGILDNGKYIVPFPSRCDWVGDQASETSYYPYDLGYLTSMLKAAGIEARLMDGQLGHVPADEYQWMIEAWQPDVLVAECGHLSYRTMTRVANFLKAVRPVKTILCGPFGTTYPERARADGWDVVVDGEFQNKVVAELLGQDWPAEPIDPNALPLPDEEDCPRIGYWEQSNIVKPMVQAYATRGCSVHCEFCTVPIYYGGYDGKSSHRTREAELVCAEIEQLVERYPKLKGIFWNEENHAANMGWLRGFAKRLIERGLNNLAYEAMCGYWTLRPADIELLAKAGYKKLRLGAENLVVEDAGGKRGKYVRAERLQQVLEVCRANGIGVHLTTMIGVPGSTEESDIATLRVLLALKGRDLFQSSQRSICTPNPGTRLHQVCQANGWLMSEDAELYHWHSAAINRPEYPAARVQAVAEAYWYYLALPNEYFRQEEKA